MARKATPQREPHCKNCGYEAEAGGWDVVESPPLGEMTQCPECGSTDVTSRR